MARLRKVAEGTTSGIGHVGYSARQAAISRRLIGLTPACHRAKTPVMSRAQHLIPLETIERRIYVIDGHNVMLDFDLAELYGVTTSRLNEQVKRNMERFPADFAFQLTREAFDMLMSQIAISNAGRGGRRKRPWAFTEHGILMLSSVLRSEQAVQVNS
jgi:hypothetical protein